MTWRIRAESDLKAFSQGLAFIVPEITMPAVKWGKQPSIPPTCGAYEPQQWPVWQDVLKDTKGALVSAVTNSCLIELKVSSMQRQSFLILHPYQLSRASEVLDFRRAYYQHFPKPESSQTEF